MLGFACLALDEDCWYRAEVIRLVGLVGREVWGEEFELPPLDLQEDIEIEQVEVGMTKEIDQGKKRKNKLEDLLRRRRAPQSGSEGEDSEESSDEIFESDTDDDEDISDTCLLDSSSDEELDVVIEAEEEPTVLPSLTELVEAADNTMLLPAIRLCLVWLKDKPEVLGQTCPGSEQLWHNLARMFTLLALQEKENIMTSVEVTQAMTEVESLVPLWEDWLVRGVYPGLDSHLAWEGKLEKGLEGVARIVKIVGVRNWLCGHQDSKISWSVCLKFLAQTERFFGGNTTHDAQSSSNEVE